MPASFESTNCDTPACEVKRHKRGAAPTEFGESFPFIRFRETAPHKIAPHIEIIGRMMRPQMEAPMAGKAKPKVAAVAEAVVEQATAVVEAVVEQGKAIVDPPPDPRGYVHVRKRDGMKFYLVRIWTPRSGPAAKKRPVLQFQQRRAVDARCHIPDGCQVVVGIQGIPRLHSDHLGTSIKTDVLGGMTREEAWAKWEAETGQKREDCSEWDSYPSARPGEKVEQVIYTNIGGSVRQPGDRG